MAWQIIQRSVLYYAKEKYPDSAPNTSSNLRACNGGQPSLIVYDNDGTLIAGFSSGTTHEGITAISAFRKSTDNGRTWGDSALDTVTIDVNPTSTNRSLFSSWRKLKYGAHAGRVIAAGARGNVVGQEQYDSYAFWSDDLSTWNAVKLPQIETYYTIGISIEQLTNGRVLCSMYTRRQGASGARSFVCYSDDAGLTWNLFDNSIINANPTTGDPGVIASDPSFVTEYKECYIGLIPDGRLMALIRSDDSIQIIRKAYSSDGGRTWTGLSTAFNGFNFPAWCTMSDGTIVCATRHSTGVAPDGNDYAEMFTSNDNGATWSAGFPLYDPALGVGSAPGCGPAELPDGRLGILITWCNPVGLELFTRWRLEYIVLDQNPESAGELNTRYDLDPNVIHPSKYLSNVLAWWSVEHFRALNHLDGTVETRWPNQMGDPAFDLIPASTGGLTLSDGSNMQSPNGLVGGMGILTNAGNKSYQLDRPTTWSQPFCAFFVADGVVGVSTLTIWDDGNGANASYRPSAPDFTLALNGVTLHFTPGAFPPGKVVYVSLINGASSSIRCNGAALTLASGGPLGATTIRNFRPGGNGNANYWHGIREIVIARTSNLTEISAYETALIAKHGINR